LGNGVDASSAKRKKAQPYQQKPLQVSLSDCAINKEFSFSPITDFSYRCTHRYTKLKIATENKEPEKSLPIHVRCKMKKFFNSSNFVGKRWQ
jgi:hypothetical protein